MVVTAAINAAPIRQGLRPVEPARDLGAIAALMEDAFADDLDDRGRAVLREMRWMARLSPLMWGWAEADPTYRDSFRGYVWEEPSPTAKGQRIVGNVSLNQAPGNHKEWIICNVVVHGEYRGRGIARQMTEAAIAEAEELGARGLILQVHEHNATALNLYRSLGFRESEGEIELRLPAVHPVATVQTSGYDLRSWRPSDGEAVYNLARLATPPVQQWLGPLHVTSYRPDWWSRVGQRLTEFMAGRRSYRLVALKDERMVAMMTVVASSRHGDHRLQLLVHPEHESQVAAALISRALHTLGAMPPRAIGTTVLTNSRALDALRWYGFEVRRTLLTMHKDLG